MILNELIDIYGTEKIEVYDPDTDTTFYATGDYFQSVITIIRNSVPSAILDREIDHCDLHSDGYEITFIVRLKMFKKTAESRYNLC
jgi:hypothetical protein